MTGFDLRLPGLTLDDARFRAAHAASDVSRPVEVSVSADHAIRARVRVERSTQPELRGTLVQGPGYLEIRGRLHYRAPLAFLAAYGVMTLACATYAAVLASRGAWAACAVLAVGAIGLLVMTWLSLHAGVAHRDDDMAWLRAELQDCFRPDAAE